MKNKDSGLWFRTLEREDVPRIHELERLCFSLPWSEQTLNEEMDANPFALYLGAFVGDRLIGYVGTWRILDEAHMTNLAVHPNFRRRGIAKALVSRIKQIMAENGVTSMTLEVRESNHVARALYRSMGFSDAGRRKRYYSDNGEDALIMWCRDFRWHKDGE